MTSNKFKFVIAMTASNHVVLSKKISVLVIFRERLHGLKMNFGIIWDTKENYEFLTYFTSWRLLWRPISTSKFTNLSSKLAAMNNFIMNTKAFLD